MKTGKYNLITDVQGLLVGNAHDPKLKSGVTVLTSENQFPAAVTVLGGAPGTRETDLLETDKLIKKIDALVLSGGSVYGLDAPSGVVDCMRREGRGYQVKDINVPIVPGAILFDLLNGGQKDWDQNPYKNIASEAYNKKNKFFELGTEGAGYGATTSNLKGGLGSSSIILDNGITIGALVATNPFGSVVTDGSNSFWASPFEIENEFGGKDFIAPEKKSFWNPEGSTFKTDSSSITNTTIAIVGTDIEMSKTELKRMSVAAHDGIARAIVPAHTTFDGDLIFSVSTCKKKIHKSDMDLAIIGHASAICLSRAIARSVYEAKEEETDIYPTWKYREENT